jgi:hypothetical protein
MAGFKFANRLPLQIYGVFEPLKKEITFVIMAVLLKKTFFSSCCGFLNGLPVKNTFCNLNIGIFLKNRWKLPLYYLEINIFHFVIMKEILYYLFSLYFPVYFSRSKKKTRITWYRKESNCRTRGKWIQLFRNIIKH